MWGPEKAGHWTSVEAPNVSVEHQFLRAGRRYRVVEPFTDFDGHLHPAGEEWVFLGSSYLPHDDGVSWFVSLDGDMEWHIRLQRDPVAQAALLDDPSAFVGEA
jgi:hypothetical protein